MLEPYSDDAKATGILIMEPDKLRAMAIERDSRIPAKFSRHRPIVPTASPSMSSKPSPKPMQARRRDRIEHAQVVAPTIFRASPANVIASMQPSHQTSDMRWAESRVGPIAVKGAYAGPPWKKRRAPGVWHRLSVRVSARSADSTPASRASFPDGTPAAGWQPQEKIFRFRIASGAYTSGSAYAEFEEGKKGELKTANTADFIVSLQRPDKVPLSAYVKTEVLRTVVGGRTVYEKP